uniref:Centriole, cilia and spindle associated protein n=1 Tax=Molossus molossus TaxID=27622 RepID=A0A7J8BLK4_MOLMO|nr:centriole, cilia and spindle associated protein [Molossus molossus]
MDTGSQKTHNVCASAPMHENSLIAKPRYWAHSGFRLKYTPRQ